MKPRYGVWETRTGSSAHRRSVIGWDMVLFLLGGGLALEQKQWSSCLIFLHPKAEAHKDCEKLVDCVYIGSLTKISRNSRNKRKENLLSLYLWANSLKCVFDVLVFYEKNLQKQLHLTEIEISIHKQCTFFDNYLM